MATKRIRINVFDSIVTAVDQVGDSWLDKHVSEWPEGVLFPVTQGIYARSMILSGEGKVTYGSYSDGYLTKERMCELYWNSAKHDGADPPTGTPRTPARLDAFVTLNLVESEELCKVLASDDGKHRQDNYFLSADTAAPFRRGRVLIKNGKNFKLANVGMYESGGGAIRRFDTVNLGDNVQFLRKFTKVMAERLMWLEENRRFSNSESGRKAEGVREYMKQKTRNSVVQNVLVIADGDPQKWGNK